MRRKRMGAVNPPEDDRRRIITGEQRLVDAEKAVEMQIWIEKLIRSPCTWPMGIFGRNIMRELGLWEDEEKMKQPKKPTLSQKKMIVSAGLDPEKWSVTHENESYLYLVERHFEGRDIRIIDKATLEVIKKP